MLAHLRGYLQLSDFLSSLGPAILNCHRDRVHHIPKRRISSLTAPSYRRRFVDGRVASGVRICSGSDTTRIVEIRVDELVNTAGNSCWPCYLCCGWNSGGITRNWALRCSRRRDLGQRLHSCNFEATERKCRIAESESKFIAWGDVVLIKVFVVDIQPLRES